MRTLILNNLRVVFDEGGLTTVFDDTITDFTIEVEALSDEDLLELYDWTVGFQG